MKRLRALRFVFTTLIGVAAATTALTIYTTRDVALRAGPPRSRLPCDFDTDRMGL